jgi:hypothetical protein
MRLGSCSSTLSTLQSCIRPYSPHTLPIHQPWQNRHVRPRRPQYEPRPDGHPRSRSPSSSREEEAAEMLRLRGQRPSHCHVPHLNVYLQSVNMRNPRRVKRPFPAHLASTPPSYVLSTPPSLLAYRIYTPTALHILVTHFSHLSRTDLGHPARSCLIGQNIRLLKPSTACFPSHRAIHVKGSWKSSSKTKSDMHRPDRALMSSGRITRRPKTRSRSLQLARARTNTATMSLWSYYKWKVHIVDNA